MANTKITDLPSANAVGSSVVPVTNAAGNATNKVTLASIAGLAPQLSDATPQAVGEAAAGSAITAARADHVHPAVSYASLTNVPSTFTPSAHSHAISDVTNLQTTLDGKATSSHTHGNVSSAGAIGSTSGKLVVTGESGVLDTATIGTGLSLSGGVLSASDSRWSLFLPPAPTNLSGTPDDTQVALTWTAPTVSAQTPITDYVVQYKTAAASEWTTFSDSTSTATSATVTGLTNGTAYVFRVAAVNGVGTGAYTSASSSLTPESGVTLQYLVIAGGGAGGTNIGGGGGAGGYLEGTATVNRSQQYTIVVGGGGGSAGSSGSGSSFLTASATGGGGGGQDSSSVNGVSGGSGGGSAYEGSAGSGTSGQGYAGSAGATSPYRGGGGGGANTAGGAVGESSGAPGGSGKASSITGSSVTRAGGGGGGGCSPCPTDGGAGGAGGGGAGGGANNSQSAGAGGSQNTGGGGGGGNANSGQGGLGGSGVVIIRSAVAAASTTGSPAVATVGSDTVYTFTGSGSITF